MGAAMRIARRHFLKTASATAGAIAFGAADPAPASQAAASPDVRIASVGYTPADYPITPHAYHSVALTDSFWKPKVDTNARVTIPLEVAKLSELEDGFRGNVLEAAILSLKTHPNPDLRARVEARIAQIAGRQARSNTGFEVAATRYFTDGRRDLLDPAVETAQRIYDDFVRNNPPFSGGERDAINCVQLYRATRDGSTSTSPSTTSTSAGSRIP